MSKLTLSIVYDEVKKLSQRIEFIEELIEELIVRELPKTKLSEEVKEIKMDLNK